MENGIIIGVLVAIVALAVYSLVKKRGKKGCCGSSDYRPRKKKLDHVRYKKVFVVNGMHCDHCSGRVMEVINDIPQVSAVVDWKRGIATVSYAQDVDDEIIRSNIQRAGYEVVEIRPEGSH